MVMIAFSLFATSCQQTEIIEIFEEDINVSKGLDSLYSRNHNWH